MNLLHKSYFNLILELVKDAIIIITKSGEIKTVNSSFKNMFGYTEGEIISKNLQILFSKKYQNSFYKKIMKRIEILPKRKKITLNLITARHKNHYEFPAKITISRLVDTGNPYFFVYIEDHTLFENINEALRISMENYSALAENASEVIIQIDKDFNIIFINSAGTRIFGFQYDELSGKHFSFLFPDGGFEQHKEAFLKCGILTESGKEKESVKMEIIGRKKAGTLFPMEISFGKWIGKGYKKSLTCIISDITRRKETEKKLRHLAYHDKLTSLGNRDLFEIFLAEILNEQEKAGNTLAALLFIDLDGFKKINDTLGHQIGDKILIECSHRINNCLRINDSIYKFQDVLDLERFTDLYRFGGDEFVILLPSIKKKEDAGIVARRIIENLKREFIIKESDLIPHVTLGCSIGITIIPDDGLNITTLIRNADMAMYKAKETGNRYVYYSQNLDYSARENLILESKIRNALINYEFENYYQPIVDFNGEITGFESLIRWNHPEKGITSPVEFFPFAEKTDLVITIGKWGLEKACRQIGGINRRFKKNFYLSANISVRQFEREDFVDSISEIIKNTEFDSYKLILEITESYIMKDPRLSIKKMEELKDRNPGLQLAIDDFGTGYSSLNYLSMLPVDIIKIDRSFVLHSENKKNRNIIISIISLAKGLKKKLIAEGVETKEALEFLIYNDCDSFQGFFFSKPLPESGIIKLVSEKKRFFL